MITNKYNIPEIFNINEEREPVEHRYSVTELLDSTRSIVLKRKYYKECITDLSETISTFIGTAIHEKLESLTPKELKAEYKLEIEFNNVTIVGKMDLWDEANSRIIDYKSTTTSKKDFEDWRKQILIYAWLVYKKYNKVTRNARIIAIMKDWSKLKSVMSNDYPKSPVFIWDYVISDSDYDYIENYLKHKTTEIEYYNNHVDELPMCSDEERWYTGDTFAVYKKEGDKRATKVFKNSFEAELFTEENGGIIKKRCGENLRCNYYCSCKEVCKKWK